MPPKKKKKSDGITKPGAGGKKKLWGAKDVLHSPFALTFPPALAGSADAICAILRAAFPTPPLRRPRVPRPAADAAPPAADASQPEAVENEAGSGSESSGSSVAAARAAPPKIVRPPGLLVGMNEVTKGLERRRVAVVVAARDVTPPVLIAHLPGLCYMRDAALVPFSGNGDDVAAALGVKKLLAFALVLPEFVSEGPEREAVEKLVVAVGPHTVKLDFPWLAVAKEKAAPPGLPEPHFAPRNKLL